LLGRQGCRLYLVLFSKKPTNKDKPSTDIAGTIIKINKEAEVNTICSFLVILQNIKQRSTAKIKLKIISINNKSQ